MFSALRSCASMKADCFFATFIFFMGSLEFTMSEIKSNGKMPMSQFSMSQFSMSRRALLRTGALTAVGLAAPSLVRAQSAPVAIRFATGGGVGPNEITTCVWIDYLKQNVLKNYGKAYTLDITYTRGSPLAAQLLAGGQVDIGTLSAPAFATSVSKGAFADGLGIIADIYQDGHPGFATNTFLVLKDSPIKTIADLKGKKVAINAFGSAVDIVLRVALKRANLDPKRDVEIVEIMFPSIGPALRDHRVDCGVLVLPFLPPEFAKGDLRALFTGADTLGPNEVAFMAASDPFIKAHPEALKALLADYVLALEWYYDPKNREKALELVSGVMQSSKDVLATYFLTPKDYYRDRAGCVSQKALQIPIDAMFEHGLIDQKIDAAKYVKLQYLPTPCAT
jgi:sulfonate transport system substrate-binding protein